MIRVSGGALRGAWLAAAAALAASAIGCSSGAKSEPEQRVVFAEGPTLHLSRFDGQRLVQLDSASIPATGLLDGHAIFGIMRHPTLPFLYVSSFNDCYAGAAWCWGNARIDRFRIGKDSVEYDGLAFAYDATATAAVCALDDWGYTGQVGGCAPVNGVFSADGTRLYVKEDDNDTLDIFRVGAGGALSLAFEGESTSLHGMAVHPTQPYVYNGSSVLDVTGDEATAVVPGVGGNSTTFVDVAGGDDLLLTTEDTSSVAIYGLADPAAPAQIDVLALGSSKARAVVMDEARQRLVAVGQNAVATVAFDGAALVLEDSVTLTEASNVENRSVALLDATHAAVSWFQKSTASPSGFIGGVTVYAIAADGTLTAGETVAVDRSARVVQAMTLP
jgi:hypothetical protein